MNTRRLLSILILVSALLIAISSYASGKKAYIAKEDEELYGIWINTDYNERDHPVKFIIKPDGTEEGYAKIDSTHSYYHLEYIITDKWTDSEGNIWYKVFYSILWYGSSKDTEPLYLLSKIDKSGNILETVRSGIDYPTELGPDVLLYTYTIYYRQ